ncbi:MAG: ABC transporter substrate-binding protein, partial [Thermomicrobiales bacterium]
YHYAWNLQVEPAVLAELEKGGKGTLVVGLGTSVERIEIQLADPNKEVDGQRAEMNTPNPVMGDIAVRQALNLSAPRDVISTQLYAGPEWEPPTANILSGIAAMASPNTSWEYNIEKGAQILEDAGWKKDGDVRKKGDVELKITYASSINPVRQKCQAIIKQGLEKMGFKVELRQVDSGVFFDGSPGNEQNINHFYNDLQMYTNNATTPIPVAYMIGWYAGPNGENIAQKSNNWNGQNFVRYNNPEYDKTFEAVRLETDITKAAELFIALNDMIINDVAVMPLINRAADKYAISVDLVNDNVAVSDFEVNYWNIANWVTKS